MISSPREDQDIDFEPEDELGSVGALQAKVQKLQDELKEVKRERQEYLDGWQRAKADMINAKKEGAETLKNARKAGAIDLITEFIPALDSFDMAMMSEAWHNVDSAWRSGVEGIYSQIIGVLQAQGVERFGKEGEVFDPMAHEAIQEVEGKGASHTVAKVIRSGYRTKDYIIRPAHVVLFK